MNTYLGKLKENDSLISASTASSIVSSATTESPSDADIFELSPDLIHLIIAIGIPTVTGTLVAISLTKNIDWYNDIKKPVWAPPSWLFGPVWLVLYILMGVASYIVYKTEGGISEASTPLLVYIANLHLNLAWSPIFFGLEKITLALVDIGLIDVTAVATAVLFYQVKPLAGWLLVPYLVWLLIATALNYAIYVMNPQESEEAKEDEEEIASATNYNAAMHIATLQSASFPTAPPSHTVRQPRVNPAHRPMHTHRRMHTATGASYVNGGYHTNSQVVPEAVSHANIDLPEHVLAEHISTMYPSLTTQHSVATD